MEYKTEDLNAGLYLVSTPIGCLDDISLRALRILQNCDRIACEDTRVSYKLLRAFNINKPLLSYHDHNAEKIRPKILAFIEAGESIALISDAGTPLIADPGFKLVQQCYQKKLYVTLVPGATAFVSAAVLSGFSTQYISFLGFASNLKQKVLDSWISMNSTLVFFEAPHKLKATLLRFQNLFSNREIAVIREITKIYEEVIRGTFEEVIQHFDNVEPRGEIVIVLSSPSHENMVAYDEERVSLELTECLKNMTMKDAVDYVAHQFALNRRIVYQKALSLHAEKNIIKKR